MPVARRRRRINATSQICNSPVSRRTMSRRPSALKRRSTIGRASATGQAHKSSPVAGSIRQSSRGVRAIAGSYPSGLKALGPGTEAASRRIDREDLSQVAVPGSGGQPGAVGAESHRVVSHLPHRGAAAVVHHARQFTQIIASHHRQRPADETRPQRAEVAARIKPLNVGRGFQHRG